MAVSDTSDLPRHHFSNNPGSPLHIDMSVDIDNITADFYEDINHINNSNILNNMIQLSIKNLHSFYQMINNTQRYTAYIDGISMIQEHSTQRETREVQQGEEEEQPPMYVMRPMSCGIEYYLASNESIQKISFVLGEIHFTLSYPVSTRRT